MVTKLLGYLNGIEFSYGVYEKVFIHYGIRCMSIISIENNFFSKMYKMYFNEYIFHIIRISQAHMSFINV